MRLLTDARIENGRRVRTYVAGGAEIKARDDADTALRIIDLFRNTEEPPVRKLDRLIALLFPEPEQLSAAGDVTSLIAEAAWDTAKVDLLGKHKGETGGKSVIDWEADAGVIEASLLRCYGLPWDEIRYRFSYDQFLALVGMVAHETPLGQALYYRTAKPPKPDKYNTEARKEFAERRRYWALKPKTAEDRYAAMSKATDKAFEAILSRSQG